MKWESHFTNLEVAEAEFAITRLRRKVNWYMQRDTKSKRLQFVRLSYVVFNSDGQCKRSRMVGAFLGRVNFLERFGWGGWELWGIAAPFSWRVGWVSRPGGKRTSVRWGRHNEDVGFRYGHLAVVIGVPGFVKRWQDARDAKRLELEAEAYERMCAEHGWKDWEEFEEEHVPPAKQLDYRL